MASTLTYGIKSRRSARLEVGMNRRCGPPDYVGTASGRRYDFLTTFSQGRRWPTEEAG
jgi:hypothetical protein